MAHNEKPESLLNLGYSALRFSYLVSNGSNTVTISNVAPGGVGTATISAWLPITNRSNGQVYYIPLWT